MSFREHIRSLAGARHATGAVAVALALALAPGAARAGGLPLIAPAASVGGEQYGANTGSLFNGGAYTQPQIDAQLAALAATGATVVRSDALWERAEPQPPIGPVHRYDWSFDDRIVRSLAAHGLRWLPIIDYSTAWAQSVAGKDHSPPAPAADYAAFAGALAARYGPGGLFWLENQGLTPNPVDTYEIWNEPDNPTFWYPSPNPAAYADLYTRARGAIVAAQPAAHVVIGGLTRAAWFLSALLASDPGLRGEVDGVGIHPYATTPDGVLAAIRGARLATVADGLGGVPLYVTEFGWTTVHRRARYWAPAAVRPRYIEQTLAALGHTDCNVAAVLLYAWSTPERNPSDLEDWFGISPPGGGATADMGAFSSGLRSAAGPMPPQPACSGPTVLTLTHVVGRAVRARVSKRHPPRRSRPRGR